MIAPYGAERDRVTRIRASLLQGGFLMVASMNMTVFALLFSCLLAAQTFAQGAKTALELFSTQASSVVDGEKSGSVLRSFVFTQDFGGREASS
jgi:hypothetical protein